MKTAVVTGAADGIGLAIAKALVNSNYKVYAIDIKKPKEVIDYIEYFQMDINDEKGIDKLLKTMKSINLLVNNAAKQIEKPFSKMHRNEIRSVLNTNLVDTMSFTHQVLPYMHEGSVIINIGSVHSNKTRLNKLTYDVSKAGLDMFTKSLALELAPRLRVNQINIGATHTPMNAVFKIEPKTAKDSIQRIPMNHIFSAEEIADAVLGMLSDSFKWMTGSIIVYDGGRSLK